MKCSFKRTRMVTSVAVALTLTWVGQPTVWAACYDDGFNDGEKACYDAWNADKCKSTHTLIAESDCKVSDVETCNREYDNLITQSECDYSGYITQNTCNTEKDGLISQDTCNAKSAGKIDKSSCDTEKKTISDQLSSCQTEKDGLISQDTCNAQSAGKIDKSSCDTEKKTISDQLSSCQTEKGGLISQDTCNAQSKDKIDKSSCETEKTTEVAKYTGYVDTANPATATPCTGVTPNSNAAANSKEKQCADQMGFDEGYKKGVNAGQLSLAGYEGTNEEEKKEAKPCQKDSVSGELPLECQQNLQSFVQGYTAGQSNPTSPPATTSMTPEESEKCNNNPESSTECPNQAFRDGYKEGKEKAITNYAGYVYTDAGGVTQSCDTNQIVPNSAADANTPEKQCADNKAFQAGFTASQLSKDKVAQADTTMCSANPGQCANVTFNAGYIKGKEEGQLSLAGRVTKDENGKTTGAESCNAVTCLETEKKQGFVDGFKAAGNPSPPASQCDPNDISNDSDCQAVKDHCRDYPADCGIDTDVVNHLQAFYDFFMANRGKAPVNFPSDLKVLAGGGKTDVVTDTAEQWKVTWVNKEGKSSCGSAKGVNDAAISLCFQQLADKKTPSDSSKPAVEGSQTKQLTEEDSLGYTVYLVDTNDNNTVKGTMEIVFSLTEEGPFSTPPAAAETGENATSGTAGRTTK